MTFLKAIFIRVTLRATRESFNQNTAIFANFVQFHHAFPTVGGQHIASFITGRSLVRPICNIFYRLNAGNNL
jgi:hypothetical protein